MNVQEYSEVERHTSADAAWLCTQCIGEAASSGSWLIDFSAEALFIAGQVLLLLCSGAAGFLVGALYVMFCIFTKKPITPGKRKLLLESSERNEEHLEVLRMQALNEVETLQLKIEYLDDALDFVHSKDFPEPIDEIAHRQARRFAADLNAEKDRLQTELAIYVRDLQLTEVELQSIKAFQATMRRP